MAKNNSHNTNIDEAIEKYGKSTGYTYLRSAVITKRNASCAILRKGVQRGALALCKYNIIDYDYADVIVKLDAVNNYQEPIEISISKQQPAKQIIRANEGNLKYCKKLKDCKGLWFYEEKNEE